MGEDQQGEIQEQLADTVELLRWIIGVLAGSAWQNLGLVPNPASKKVVRDLEDARLAIDAAASLIEHLKLRVDEKERRDLDTLLANLRLNFVEQSAKPESTGCYTQIRSTLASHERKPLGKRTERVFALRRAPTRAVVCVVCGGIRAREA